MDSNRASNDNWKFSIANPIPVTAAGGSSATATATPTSNSEKSVIKASPAAHPRTKASNISTMDG